MNRNRHLKKHRAQRPPNSRSRQRNQRSKFQRRQLKHRVLEVTPRRKTHRPTKPIRWRVYVRRNVAHEVRNENTMTTPFLIVLRAADMKRSRAFYEAIGLQFIEEQHGKGPIHVACETEHLVIEIYPGEEAPLLEAKQSGATMLGFNVESLDETLAQLRVLDVMPKSLPKVADWGTWCNVVDPDGRVIQLNQ